MAKNDGPGLYDAVGRIMKMTLITRSVHVKRVGGYWGHSQCSFPHRLPASGSISTISHFFPPPYIATPFQLWNIYLNRFSSAKSYYLQLAAAECTCFTGWGVGEGGRGGRGQLAGFLSPLKGKLADSPSPLCKCILIDGRWNYTE